MAEDQATSYQEKYSGLMKKKQLEFHKVVEDYQWLDAFLQLKDKHDNEMRPVNMSLGWNKAAGVVHYSYPDMVNPADFLSP